MFVPTLTLSLFLASQCGPNGCSAGQGFPIMGWPSPPQAATPRWVHPPDAHDGVVYLHDGTRYTGIWNRDAGTYDTILSDGRRARGLLPTAAPALPAGYAATIPVVAPVTATPAAPAAPPPTPAAPPPVPAAPPATALELARSGIPLDKLDGKRAEVSGKPATPAQVYAAVTDGKQIPDDARLPVLTGVGAAGDQLRKDVATNPAFAPYRDHVRVCTYAADDPAVKDRGFREGVYLQRADGYELYRSATYDAEATVSRLRQLRSDYDPDKGGGSNLSHEALMGCGLAGALAACFLIPRKPFA